MPKITNTVERAPVSHIPREIAISALITTRKLSSRLKRFFMRARGNAIQIECGEGKPAQEKFCAKLKTLSLTQLDSRWAQACQRIARAERLLLTMHPDSQHRPSVEQEKAWQSYCRGWILQEMDSRVGCPGCKGDAPHAAWCGEAGGN